MTTSPGSAVRVATVPANGAMTVRSLRLARASSSWARARSASACRAAMSAWACRICPWTAATCEERIAGLVRLARAVVMAPRAASTWRLAAVTTAAWACSVLSFSLASITATRPISASRVKASRSHFACVYEASACASWASAVARRASASSTRPWASARD